MRHFAQEIGFEHSQSCLWIKCSVLSTEKPLIYYNCICFIDTGFLHNICQIEDPFNTPIYRIDVPFSNQENIHCTVKFVTVSSGVKAHKALVFVIYLFFLLLLLSSFGLG